MSTTPIEFINTPDQLRQAAATMAECQVLCVDTEFHRESTFYPEFALLQIYGNGQCWVIDPITIKDLAPVWDIMLNPAILKVFHAARQDIEIIFNEAGGLPLPLFDTQVAAALLGYGQQVGFGNLVQRITKKLLPKGESFTDWKARPLTKKQMAYAADDVIWLMPVFQHLKERLEAAKRTQWLQEEQQTLCSPETYQPNDADAFWRVKGFNRLKGRHLAVLQEMAAWRERSAQQRDIPRRRMIADEPLLELARRDLLDIETMQRIRGINAGFIKRFGDEIIACWQRGMERTEESWPSMEARRSNTHGTDLRLEMLDTLVRLKAEEGEISGTILASKSDLSALASWGYRCKGEPPEVACLHGWRYELVGHDLIRLLRGEICLHLNSQTGMPEISPYEQAQ
ncbi:ribonuclease D [Mariprofundus ferrooxydans]|uniref:Ribonuclease D n=1 Tax=Mariprofundus ferrooxydans PV-1 TaxID=314345 RepID=Q0F2Y2_9PROT|nr:ribonuclease D [Mariprofundus ferrooxydans]EAU56159.1 ribonuclease D [Mariprofundus ferrooxydans PV-1]KON48073.1 ribonuclease D [Mariprofundus ferrooxydans]